MARKRLEEWQMVAWVLFLVAFIGAGSVPFDTLHRKLRVTNQGPTNSSDTMYLTHLELKHGSVRIAETLRDLPAGSHVAVLLKFGTYRILCAQLICHAAWIQGLRPVLVPADAEDAAERVRIAGAVAAFSLEGEPPSWFREPTVLSPALSFARIPAE
jgi:hypothetical protein